MTTPHQREPRIEVHASAQPTLTALVRAPQHEVARELTRAIHALEQAAGDASLHHVFVAFRRFDPQMMELAVSVPIHEQCRNALPLEPAELPAGRYLTIVSGLARRELASVLPRVRDWLGAHHESAVGPLVIELVHDKLILRQRILGGRALGAMALLREDAVSTVVHALRAAQHGQPLEVPEREAAESDSTPSCTRALRTSQQRQGTPAASMSMERANAAPQRGQ